MLDDVKRHGWHIIAIPEDEVGPGFAFTVGLFLHMLQPEILIMGVPFEPAGRVLNAIGEFLMEGGQIEIGRKYSEFVDGRPVIFRRIASGHYRDYLGLPYGSIKSTRRNSRRCNVSGQTWTVDFQTNLASTNASPRNRRTSPNLLHRMSF
jgi:hypothetical protein